MLKPPLFRVPSPAPPPPPPPQERLELGYTDAVDVWAVGVLAYELLVGKPPFERKSREETYAYIQRKDPALPAWLSEGAKDFIMTALAKVGTRGGGAVEAGREQATRAGLPLPTTSAPTCMHLCPACYSTATR